MPGSTPPVASLRKRHDLRPQPTVGELGANEPSWHEAPWSYRPLGDVGEHRLHLHCEGVGSPTVVLEAGGGNSSVTFRPLMRVLAASTRVCAYDRAGFGYSGPQHSERDAERVAAELLELLTRACEAGPYVVAAHSMGGLYAITLASERPEQVAGLVLVDVIPPTYLVPLPEPLASSIGLFDVCRSGLARGAECVGSVGRVVLTLRPRGRSQPSSPSVDRIRYERRSVIVLASRAVVVCGGSRR